jgi:hypothetical protein
LVGSSFYFSKYTFDSVPIPMCTVLKSEAVAVAGGLQPWCAIDEDGRVVDEMFLAEFRKEHLGQRLCSRQK